MKAMEQGAFDVPKDVKESSIVGSARSRHVLTDNVNSIGNVRTSYYEIDKSADELAIKSSIREKSPIERSETNLRINWSRGSFAISKTSTSQKVGCIFGLGQIGTSRIMRDFKA